MLLVSPTSTRQETARSHPTRASAHGSQQQGLHAAQDSPVKPLQTSTWCKLRWAMLCCMQSPHCHSTALLLWGRTMPFRLA